MPIFFQKDIDEDTKLAVWKIEEEETFFDVPLERPIAHSHKRLQHLAGRYLLRYLFPQFPLALIQIADTRKPYLSDDAFHFSISHCGEYAAAIVSRTRRVGIDIEVPTAKVERVKQKFLHLQELTEYEVQWNGVKSRGDERDLQNALQHLTLLWSAKEAIFKWWSYGNVDFSEMIRLQVVNPQPSGIFKAQFTSGEKQFPLQVAYRLYPTLCLAWVAG